MDLKGVQQWVKKEFEGKLDELPVEYGISRLLTQAGQLGEAVLHNGDVGKELSDVMFVLAGLANKSGVDLEQAVEKHLTGCSAEEILTKLDQR